MADLPEALARGAGRPPRTGAAAAVGELAEKVLKTLGHWGIQAVRAQRAVRARVASPPVERPIFVLGCSRAGTTLVYKTLSASPRLGTLHSETHDFWASLHPPGERGWRSHALGAEDVRPGDREKVIHYFYTRTGRVRFVDKNNQNGLCVEFLDRLFPRSHFVFVKRDPGDNINSLIEGWARPQEFATWSSDLPLTVAVEEGRFAQWCFFLPDGWRDYVTASVEDVCALQYRSMNEAILGARAGIPAERWAEVFYEDLVRDPVEAFRAAFSGCDVDFDRRMERWCRGVLSTPYNAFSPVGLDKWRAGANAARIERVLPDVGDVAARMGYPPRR